MIINVCQTDIMVFTGNVIMCLTSHWQIIYSIRVSLLIEKEEFEDTKGVVMGISNIFKIDDRYINIDR